MSVNLKELSRRLNLSPTTVSRALNGYADVGAATRTRVQALAESLGYQPNAHARRLASGRADAVGIVYSLDTDDVGDPNFLRVLQSLGVRVQHHNKDLLLIAAHAEGELRSYERLIQGQRVDGFIIARTLVSDPRIACVLRSNMPFVAYGRTAADAPEHNRFAWFDFDNRLGTQLAVQALHAQGHRRIAYVHAPIEMNFAHQRHAGFVQAMQSLGLPLLPQYMRSCEMHRQHGHAIMQQLLALPEPPQAVICDHSITGVGVVQAAQEAHVRLGQDLSLVVYDGLPVGAPYGELTGWGDIARIDQPTPEDAGRIMADMLISLIQHRTLAQPHVLKQPVYVAAASVGAARN